MAEAAHPLGHNHLGYACHLPAQGLAQGGVSPVIQRAGGIVQHQNVRLSSQGPGNGQPLLLTAGQVVAPNRHGMAHPLLKDVIRLSRPGGPIHLLLGQLPAKPDVPRQSALHDEVILKHHAKLGPQLLRGDGPDVPAFQKDRTLIRVIKPEKQIHQSGFSTASGPQDP